MSISDPKSWKDLKFKAQATYRIRVLGHIDDMLADRLGGMVLTRVFRENNQKMMILIGRVEDQAALTRVMNTLYSLHLSVLSVDFLD